MNRSEYQANQDLQPQAPQSWAHPAPVRAVRRKPGFFARLWARIVGR